MLRLDIILIGKRRILEEVDSHGFPKTVNQEISWDFSPRREETVLISLLFFYESVYYILHSMKS